MNDPVKTNQGSQPKKLPLFVTRVPDFETLNTRLLQTIDEMKSSSTGRETNQPDGQSYFANKWLSSSDVHQSASTDIQQLVLFIEESANRVFHKPEPDMTLSIFSMWCMVSKTDMTGTRHNHSGRVSGVYYVATGSSSIEHGGSIHFFQNPGSHRSSHHLTPETGRLLLFPSSLEHSVCRYTGPDSRTVIAFNLR